MNQLRLALPPSNSRLDAPTRELFARYLGAATSTLVTVEQASSYGDLTRQLLTGQVTAAWAPPVACARLEKAGVPILVRALREGQATYRAALVARAGTTFGVDDLRGRRAAWVDRESTGGYLLVAALLQGRGAVLDHLFSSQQFLGSYPAALKAVLSEAADVASIFAKPAGIGGALGLSECVPGHEAEFRTLVFTEEAPNDGVAVAPLTPRPLCEALERALVDAAKSPEGRDVLKKVLRADGFERAPAAGYQAFYKALHSPHP